MFMDEVQTVRLSRPISGEFISACSLFRVKVFHTQSIHRGDVITSTVQHSTVSGVLALRMCGRAHSSVQAEHYIYNLHGRGVARAAGSRPDSEATRHVRYLASHR